MSVKRLAHSEYDTLKLSILDSVGNVHTQEIKKLSAEGLEGSFCLYPHHINYVSNLRLGILSYEALDGSTGYFAIDEGVLNKVDDHVIISTINAIYSSSLEELKSAVFTELTKLVDEDRDARKAILQMEYSIMMTLMQNYFRRK